MCAASTRRWPALPDEPRCAALARQSQPSAAAGRQPGVRRAPALPGLPASSSTAASRSSKLAPQRPRADALPGHSRASSCIITLELPARPHRLQRARHRRGRHADLLLLPRAGFRRAAGRASALPRLRLRPVRRAHRRTDAAGRGSRLPHARSAPGHAAAGATRRVAARHPPAARRRTGQRARDRQPAAQGLRRTRAAVALGREQIEILDPGGLRQLASDSQIFGRGALRQCNPGYRPAPRCGWCNAPTLFKPFDGD
ncbi:MAG: hypothetical protein MZW92_11500 [Comamonadaceae bacterium]|nr:hypothetical protein [Comamonadaceae bacterium]